MKYSARCYADTRYWLWPCLYPFGCSDIEFNRRQNRWNTLITAETQSPAVQLSNEAGKGCNKSRWLILKWKELVNTGPHSILMEIFIPCQRVRRLGFLSMHRFSFTWTRIMISGRKSLWMAKKRILMLINETKEWSKRLINRIGYVNKILCIVNLSNFTASTDEYLFEWCILVRAKSLQDFLNSIESAHPMYRVILCAHFKNTTRPLSSFARSYNWADLSPPWLWVLNFTTESTAHVKELSYPITHHFRHKTLQ